MNWLTTTFIAVLFLSASNIFLKYYLPKLGSGLSIFYFTLAALLVTIVLTFVAKVGEPAVKHVGYAPLFAMVSGILWAIGNFFFFTIFIKNAPLSLVMPIVVGGIGVGGIITGVILFHESLNMAQIAGILIVLSGSIIIARS